MTAAKAGQQPPAGDPPTDPPAQQPAAGLTRDDVQGMIREALQGTTTQPPAPAGDSGRRPTAAQQGDSITDQVRAEVERIRERENAEKHRTDTDTRLKELEGVAKKIAQAPPVQYRKITQWLWGDR